MSPPPSKLRFPYMVFARTAGASLSWSLAQSGMPPAERALFEGAGAEDLGFAGAEALPLLRERLAAHFSTSPERVLPTLGASGAMAVLALAWFRPPARVCAETPSYEPLRALPPWLGAGMCEVRRRPEESWRVDPALVRRALAGARPGHLLLTNPHNPSGALLGEGEVRELAREAERAGGILVSNEVYMEYAPPEKRVRAFQLAPNAVSIGSLTKAYGLGALRCGWIALGEETAAERPLLEDAVHLVWVDPPTGALRMALRALERLSELRRPLEELERTSKPRFLAWLRQTEGVEATEPPFGLIAFPRIAGVTDTMALQRHLAREQEVGVVPGEFFGAPGHLRLGFGLSEDHLAEALERLARGLVQFRAQ